MSTSPWTGEKHVQVGPDYPVVYVNWQDAMSFCQKLTDLERRSGRLQQDWEYALPSKAQWEHACRAGTRTRYSFGDEVDELDRYAWYLDNAFLNREQYGHEVGKKLPNAWQLYDVHGNVWEWCRDSYAEKLPGVKDPLVAKEESRRVARGASWRHEAKSCRSAVRYGFDASVRQKSQAISISFGTRVRTMQECLNCPNGETSFPPSFPLLSAVSLALQSAVSPFSTRSPPVLHASRRRPRCDPQAWRTKSAVHPAT